MLKITLKAMARLAVGLLIAQAGFAADITITPYRPTDTVSTQGTSELKTQKEMTSYSLGVETARGYKRLGMDVDIDLIIRGMKDVVSGSKLLMTDDDITSALVEFRGQVLAKAQGERLIAGLDNKKEGDEFLAVNKTKEGIMVQPSGLQYKILKAGNGRKPTAQDTVEVHYKGSLINGTLFLNTYDTGQPATIKVSDPQVIAGVREALKLMPVGSTWRLFIPSKLAYLNMGRPPHIGPNATLIYEVELLAIK
jgi:FKBP-type peptidyl-prolyl cis-trans isomerase